MASIQLYFLKTNQYLNKKCRHVLILRTSVSAAIRDVETNFREKLGGSARKEC